jgi:hypothetical protein
MLFYARNWKKIIIFLFIAMIDEMCVILTCITRLTVSVI